MQHTLQIYFANNASVYKLRQLNYYFKKYKKTEILRKTYNSILVNLIIINKSLLIINNQNFHKKRNQCTNNNKYIDIKYIL